MARKTAKNSVEVWDWIESNPHHIVRTIYNQGGNYESGIWGIQLAGHHNSLFIPKATWKRTALRAGDEFDTRMYRATKYGRAKVRAWKKSQS